ncbi:DUF4811 domain-containing protein [Weissella minor]|uniref:DUF4811 domain-containing protein n=1 Tax=Weissella minor TaxID=1620 RepID=A0A0R2JLG3_9LACO|nr:DUF4811 domain-containing protein [Weissella minor]KRN76710.1 hypothetical protein IV67_GL000215 [Weissella minor]
MIIVLLLLFVVLTFVTWIYIKPLPLRIVAGSLAVLGLVLSIAGITLNFTDHYGMKQVTKTTEQQIYSAGDKNSPANMLLAQEIGDDSGNYVLVYRENENDAEPKPHHKPDQKHIIEAVKKTADYKESAQATEATSQTKTTRWVFKNDMYKLLFGISDQQNELVKETTTVTVPEKTWVVMSPKQAEELGKQQQKMPAQAREMQAKQTETAVKEQMMAYMQKHPDASAAEQKAQSEAMASEMAVKAIKTQLK